MAATSLGAAQERRHSDSSRLQPKKSSAAPRGLDALFSSSDVDLEDGFFIPSYLSHSVYVQQLERQHAAKAQAKQTKRQSGNGLSKTATDPIPAPVLPPGSHRGMSHAVIERSSSDDDAEALVPLPSRWNEDDSWPGIEVEPQNTVKIIPQQKGYHDREQDASGIRANNYIQPQCGIYYYEVTILGGKKDE